MEDSRLLLGFDARDTRTAAWDARRRDLFLIRTDVTQPYSTDVAVWPAVIDGDMRPGDCLAHQNLWNDKECLRSSLNSIEAQEYTTVAITLDLHGIAKDDLNAWKEVAIEDDSKQSTWQFLGYDVSDRWFTSALSNCGFLPEENVDALREQWRRYLNDRHLFHDVESARSFKNVSNRRVVEHSPFFVFALWSA